MRVLLSIKPEYANKIFDGTKKFEFRKILFKNPEVKTVVVYASSPVQKVIGEFEIEKILSLTPELLWEKTCHFSGISSKFFFEYFADRSVAHAIEIKSTKKYKEPRSIKEEYNAIPPQSFLYLT
ncbi:putative transcriptional regulator [Arcticibacter pallidicorallinus]|uniref:Putative transcriptional regulator n=1 Tax=Arcticibacter pallidicorallinus TaxID=1259464 RepID=A0A2T0TQU2_9SPHI|nr:ASCH domain-containing protein [Arcticibacter pallidicorallinus]PRY48050.1 putative transcriptional regulator [Arcticibacter pallidicorallinus]